MGRRRTGGVGYHDGAWYARVTLSREPKRAGRHPRAEVRVPDTDGRPPTEAAARTFAARVQALYDEGRWTPDRLGVEAQPAKGVVVERWVADWCARQKYTTAAQDAARVAHYLKGSSLAALPVARVTPRDVAAWLAHARRTPSARGTAPAERTVRNAFDVLRRALAGAVFAGLLAQDPCAVLPSDVRPQSRDARPEKRRAYRLALGELEALLSDNGTPDDRLVLYHLLALTGARLGEATALRWCDLSPREPLPAVVLAEQFDPKRKTRRATKTLAVREVPLHPTLGAALAWWRAQWPRWYGREAQPGDLIVPARKHRLTPSVGGPRRQPAVWRELQSDLAGCGVAPRRVHDIRHTFVSLCADAGMAADVVTRWTHAPTEATARSLYLLPSWTRQAAEMGRLVVRSGLVARITAEEMGGAMGGLIGGG